MRIKPCLLEAPSMIIINSTAEVDISTARIALAAVNSRLNQRTLSRVCLHCGEKCSYSSHDMR
ncbi:MAG: hypothetical protein HC871_04250 [Rhizobiales bacterium]|nr:hypothetical protein [Hyphomicrobiales bacterium]